MSAFERAAVNGDAIVLLKMAAVNGALWAVGISWSTAIRAIALVLLPDDTMDVVAAELAAAGVVTVLGIGIAYVAGRTWCRAPKKVTEPAAPVLPVRRQLAPSPRR